MSTTEEDTTGGKVQEECRGTLRDPRCLGPTLKHACRICYFLADRTTTVLCGRPGPLGHFSSARRHSACMHGVVGCLRPAIRTPREGVFFLLHPLGVEQPPGSVLGLFAASRRFSARLISARGSAQGDASVGGVLRSRPAGPVACPPLLRPRL